MSQTTLNLVAITIFVMVMASLLGPLFHVSPFVPATIAFGMLGVATLDLFSWQGRAGTLLVDWAASFSDDYRARVLRHEAGHFLAAHLLNIPVTGYSLTAWEALRQGQPGRGGVSFATDLLDAPEAQVDQQLIDRFCTVWMAGAAAEILSYGNAEGGGDDRQKLRSVWAQMRRDQEGALKERWAALQAKTLLEENWAAFEALVQAMEQRNSVADCCSAIDEALGSQALSS
jgi:hypothetical protein